MSCLTAVSVRPERASKDLSVAAGNRRTTNNNRLVILRFVLQKDMELGTQEKTLLVRSASTKSPKI